MRRAAARVPHEVWAVLVLAVALAALSANPLLTIAGAAVLPVIFVLLWRRGEPAALLFAAGFQWLQVYVPVLSADFAGLDMANADVPKLDVAAFLGLASIVALVCGMKIGRGRTSLAPPAPAQVPSALDARRLLVAYAVAHVVTVVANTAGEISPGLRQPLLGLTLLRWGMVFLIVWTGLMERRLRWMAVLVVGLELAIGFLGFFSGFRIVLSIAIVVGLGLTPDRRRLLRAPVVVVGLLTIVLGVFWQAVKGDYRAFLNQGQQSQVVLVSAADRMQFLLEKASSLELEDLKAGLESGAERTGYIEYFARALENVPRLVPHQDGRLWGEALGHVFMPRLLFPDKPAIDDSERVNEFSGVTVADATSGSSISLGYAAESYVDFGPLLMFVPVFLLGMFWGWSYRVLATTGPHRLLSLSLATGYLLLGGGTYFESSNIKLVGGAISSMAVVYLVLRFGAAKIWPRLVVRRSAPQPHQAARIG